jgi:hypothetical protein
LISRITPSFFTEGDSRTTKHIRVLLFFLVTNTFYAFAQDGFSPFSTNFPPEEFARRRSALYDAIGSSALALIRGAPAPVAIPGFGNPLSSTICAV